MWILAPFLLPICDILFLFFVTAFVGNGAFSGQSARYFPEELVETKNRAKKRDCRNYICSAGAQIGGHSV